MDSTLDQITATGGGVVGTKLLKQAQDIAGQQAAQLVAGLPEAPATLPGKGDNVNLYV